MLRSCIIGTLEVVLVIYNLIILLQYRHHLIMFCISGVTLNLSSNYDPANNPFEAAASSNPFEAEEEETNSSAPAAPPPTSHPFKGIISQCFEPFLTIYIDAQDRNLSELIERFAADGRKQQAVPAPESSNGSGGGGGLGEEGSPVLSSCGDLFVFYKKCLVQCSELSTGQPMLALAQLFRKYLREYIQRVIVPNLPKVGGGSGGGGGVASSGGQAATGGVSSVVAFPAMSQFKDLKAGQRIKS